MPIHLHLTFLSWRKNNSCVSHQITELSLSVVLNRLDAMALELSSSCCGEPSYKIILLLSHNCNFTTAVSCNVSI